MGHHSLGLAHNDMKASNIMELLSLNSTLMSTINGYGM